MILKDYKKFKLPDTPGVYFFKDKKKILYIGKATSLKSRTRSYFNKDAVEARGPKIEMMVEEANKVEWRETDSVLEALILEMFLIKKYKPPYNTRDKDDKSFLYLVITKEDFPRVLLTRGKMLRDDEPKDFQVDEIYGPFPQAYDAKEALRLIRRLLPYRDTCQPGQIRPCFNAQIGLCPGVCEDRVTKEEYAKTIKNIKLFFEGEKQKVIKNLEKEMMNLAKKQEFEEAAKVRRSLFGLKHIQDVSLIREYDHQIEKMRTRIEAYDIAHTAGKETTGAMVVWQNGELDKNEYRKFRLRGFEGGGNDDPANLQEVLKRRFNHPEWPSPELIVVDGSKIQVNAAEKVLTDLGLPIEVVGVTKDERHKATSFVGSAETIEKFRKEIVLINSEAHRFALDYHRKLRGRMIK